MCVIFVVFMISVSGVNAQQQQQQLLTPCEASGFTEYTTHTQMMDYLLDVQASSTEMRLGTYGSSYEGRELAFAIFSRPSIRQPWEALVSGKPIVLLNANVHGGERTLRESLLIMIRDLATPGTALNGMLDELVILVAPSVNPDGLMADPRPTRGNAWGQDLNRDYMKLEQQALANFITNLANVWHPHVVVDGHNGGSFPYNVTYQSTSNAAPALPLGQLCQQEIFPFIDRRMEDNGYQSFYYSSGDSLSWRGGGYDPRISRNYHSFTNRIGILFESPGRQEMSIGIPSGAVAYTAVLEFVMQNTPKVLKTVTDARLATVQMGDAAAGMIPVQQEYQAEDFPVTYQVQVPRGEERVLITVEEGQLMTKPLVTAERERPWAYLLPREAVDAIAMLERHNIAIEILQEPVTVEVQAYVMESVSYQREYNHSGAVNVTVGEVVTLTQEFPAGTYVIPTGQLMGRVAAHLLEPETNDNVVHWNTMDAWLPLAEPRQMRARPGQEPRPPQLKIIPIYKVMSPTAMPTLMKK
jgi:hypothetical protein